ncbi:hypothetical protein B0T25DRAFT_515997 [Lasiosphaeria hispida]|uniref:Uncharacterized protein n=1 Tax=Lasiosphaeria hispida TaxID=260671 RepID=A0AAJ0HK79_9PEZI|nr:hypothetical protein B0T25DRAFT_515997 [Lasiosphaeria hispida]
MGTKAEPQEPDKHKTLLHHRHGHRHHYKRECRLIVRQGAYDYNMNFDVSDEIDLESAAVTIKPTENLSCHTVNANGVAYLVNSASTRQAHFLYIGPATRVCHLIVSRMHALSTAENAKLLWALAAWGKRRFTGGGDNDFSALPFDSALKQSGSSRQVSGRSGWHRSQKLVASPPRTYATTPAKSQSRHDMAFDHLFWFLKHDFLPGSPAECIDVAALDGIVHGPASAAPLAPAVPAPPTATARDTSPPINDKPHCSCLDLSVYRMLAGAADLGSKLMQPWESAALFHKACEAVFETISNAHVPFNRPGSPVCTKSIGLLSQKIQ